MSDLVIIEGLECTAVIGCYDWERTIRQPIVMDLTMHWDNQPAAQSDDLSYALDYEAVSNRVVSFVEASEFRLIEALAERVAQLVLTEFNVPKLVLKLQKPTAIKAAKNIAIQIERSA